MIVNLYSQGIAQLVTRRALALGIDWHPELEKLGAGPYNARQIVDAVSAAAEKNGVPNTLTRDPLEDTDVKAFLGE